MSGWTLIYYESAAGSRPVADYLDDLSAGEAERVTRKLDLLEAMGTDLKSPHVAHVTGKIWELRVTGRIQHRVLYVAFARQQMLMLHAFTKKTQKTPRREIDIAEARMADYEMRNL